jgi:RNA polymerase sigma-70 factor (ECF subfamily)
MPMSSASINDAIAACKAGDLSAFDTLYTEYVERLYGYLYRRTLHRQTAEDLTSTTFLKALERIAQFNPKRGTFSAWLYGIARNTLTDHFRTHRTHADIQNIWDLASDDDTRARTDAVINAQKIHDALRILDPLKREIVLLRVWENLSYREIAQIVGKSEGNCKTIFCRALESLREECGPSLLTMIILFPFLR